MFLIFSIELYVLNMTLSRCCGEEVIFIFEKYEK